MKLRRGKIVEILKTYWKLLVLPLKPTTTQIETIDPRDAEAVGRLIRRLKRRQRGGTSREC